MANETLTTTGQTDTAPAAQQPAVGAGTAPAEDSQQQTQAATTDAPAADPAKGEAPKADEAKAAPEQYTDFTVPEGYTMAGELGTEFKSLAKELNLTQEQAQRIVDLDVKRAQAQTESLYRTSAEWQASAKTDKEFGGANLEQNVAIAKKAMDAFGTPELRKLLNDSGLGNHPEVIRVFYRAGKAISEDRFVPGGTGDPKGPRDSAKALYPNQSA